MEKKNPTHSSFSYMVLFIVYVKPKKSELKVLLIYINKKRQPQTKYFENDVIILLL